MPITIHGKEYVTVAERVTAAHEELEKISIQTEVLRDEPVVIKATVETNKGTFTGISAANPAKSIEKQNPYEVAETSAVGRALGFAGFGSVESIASADEMIKAGADKEEKPQATSKQIGMIGLLGSELGWANTKLTAGAKKLFGVETLPELNIEQASEYITKLKEVKDKEETKEDSTACENCDADITGTTANNSLKKYGKMLCMACQLKENK